jgi:hypothetical protein
MLVCLASDPLKLPAHDGDVPETGRLGLGIVREPVSGGKVHIHWIEPDCEAWMRLSDVRLLPTTSKLVSIYRYNHGQRNLVRQRLIGDAGLLHHWLIELLPDNIVRAVRSDGLAWTFNWYPLLNRVEPLRQGDPDQLEDADAEALAAVNTALELPDWNLLPSLVPV